MKVQPEKEDKGRVYVAPKPLKSHMSPTPTIYIGIDPGASGGVAMLHGDDAQVWKMPDTEEDIWRLIAARTVCPPGMLVSVTIERVGGHTGEQANVPGMGASMFNFGRNVGVCVMCVRAASGSFPREITPQDWQSGIDIPERKWEIRKGRRVKIESSTEFKSRLLQIARTRFPSIKLTKSTCDALLIASYDQQRMEGRYRS